MFIGTFFGSISLCLSENDKMNIFPFFSRSGTTFKNTVGESSPQNGSTRGLNLVLIVIVLLAIFILAIAVVFGISFFRRHQDHKNQGKFVALFAYLLIFLFSWNKISRLNIEGRSGNHFLVWYSTLLSWCQVFGFFTRLVIPLNGIFFMTECINVSSLHSFIIYIPSPTDFSFQKRHNRMCLCLVFRRFVQFSSNVIWLYFDPLCLGWILRQAFYGTFGFFEDRKCGGVPRVIDDQPSFFNTSSFLLNFSEYVKNLNKHISLTYFEKIFPRKW